MSPVRTGGTRQAVVRVAPVALAASAQVRLRRLAPGATYREDMAQLLVPITEGELPAETVRGVIEALLPAADAGRDGGTL